MRAARAGTGSVLAFAGAPGIGKTSLLSAAAVIAGETEMRVLSASGAELETELAYGIVRQLFGRLAARHRDDRGLWDGAAELARPVVEPDSCSSTEHIDQYGVLHGLYWLCASLAERRPLAVIVDDAHWADGSSLRWLAYVARRVSDMPVAVIVAHRPMLELSAPAALAGLAAGDATISRTLAPLSEEATTTIVRRAVGGEVPDEVCRSCHAVTGGNPFYLSELVKAGGQALLSSNAPVEAMAPESVMRSVVVRLAGLGPAATRLAGAVAVLGARAQLRHAATLAQLRPRDADTLADGLAEAGILSRSRPLQFAHPIVRAAVYGDLPLGARSTLHRRAAELYDGECSDPATVATQLLVTEPYGDRWVVARLREAARAARARGDLQAGAAYLRRALREPPEPHDRGEVLFELGAIERQLVAPQAEEHLLAALELTGPPRRRAQVAAELMPLLIHPHGLPAALQVIEQVLPGAIDEAPELGAQLEANRVGLPTFHLAATVPDTTASYRLLERLDPVALPARLLRGVLATEAMVRGRPLSEVSELLDGALVDRRTRIAEATDVTAFFSAVITAAMCERFDLAEQAYTAALVESQRRGSVFAAGAIWTARSQFHFRLGDVRAAEADARQARDAVADLIGVSPTAMLLDVLIERDDIAGALALLDETGFGGDLPASFFSLLFLVRRIRLRVAAGRVDDALADLAIAQRWATDAGMAQAATIQWRSEGALACAAAGEDARARELADEQLRLARGFGAPGVLGVALRVAGLVRGGDTELLAASVDALASTPMRLEHARALAGLGVAQRRAGARALARETLAEALDLADACGSAALATQARSELRLLGARPRRNRRRGRDALTATELRVATLAADGMTNAQIAQAAFVTAKTVERHLTNVYAKLAIRSRHELRDALGDGARGHARSLAAST